MYVVLFPKPKNRKCKTSPGWRVCAAMCGLCFQKSGISIQRNPMTANRRIILVRRCLRSPKWMVPSSMTINPWMWWLMTVIVCLAIASIRPMSMTILMRQFSYQHSKKNHKKVAMMMIRFTMMAIKYANCFFYIY